MKKTKIKLLSLFLVSMIFCSVIPHPINKVSASFEEIPALSLEKCKKAEIYLGEKVKGTNIEIIKDENAGAGDELYAGISVYDGETSHEVSVANKLNFRFTGDFASPEDDLFLFAFRYWDYAGGGKFYLDYASEDGDGIETRVEVMKRGLMPDGSKAPKGQWRYEYVVIAGARFTQTLTNGADFKIANRAGNAFTNIEVYNLAPIAEQVAHLELGTFASEKAQVLFNLGLLEAADSKAVTALLPEKLDRQTAIYYTVKFLGLSKKAEESAIECTYSDVDTKYASSVAYAKSIGLINKSGTELGAKDIIKERELIEYYLKYFKLSTDGDIVKTSKENKIVFGADVIFQTEKEALIDNLFAIGSNVVRLISPGGKDTIIMKMLNDGIVTFNGIMQSSDPELAGKLIEEPFYCPPEERIDPWTKRKYYVLSFFGSPISRPYFTQQSFSDDNETMVFCDYNNFIYLYNIRTYMTKKIGTIIGGKANPSYVSMTFRNGTDELYYINNKKELIKYDVGDEKETLLYTLPGYVINAADISVSKDGTRVAFDIWKPNFPYSATEGTSAYYDIADNEYREKDFFDFSTVSWEGWYHMHTSMNPVHKNIILFCSGGSTIPDPFINFIRCFSWNTETDAQGPLFQEYRTTYGPKGMYMGDNNGHESWTGDGEWLIVNKAATQYSGRLYSNGTAGLMLVSPDGRDRKYVGPAKVWNYEKKKWVYSHFTHPGADPTGQRWAVSDDSNFSLFYKGEFPLMIMDTESGASYLPLARIKAGPSDYHPHPAFSQNLQYVVFGTIDDNKQGMIGWVDVSDITSLPQRGGRVELSESCEALDYEDFEYDLDKIKVNGEDAYRIRADKKMYINALNDVVWGVKKDVTFQITYLDNGVSPMKLEYVVWKDNTINQHLFKRYITIKREGKGGWKTAEVTLRGINMDNTEMLATDVKLSGSASELIIKEVTVKEAKEE